MQMRGRSNYTGARVPLGALVLLLCLVLPRVAFAGLPSHNRKPALDIAGLDHACGTAVDSEGDVYASSAGESKVEVFSAAHDLLAEIPNAHEPCALAVDGNGDLYVSERGTGEVVRYAPDAYPLSGAPVYGPATTIDASGSAKGIAVDPHDDRLYVAEGTHVAQYGSGGSFEANLGDGTLTAATGVAVYSYAYKVTRTFEGKLFEENGTRYLFVADAQGAEPDAVKVLSGSFTWETPGPSTFGPLTLRRTIGSVDEDRSPETAPQAIGLGPAGAYVAADPGNRNEEEKCSSVDGQACTEGHFLVYDAAHGAVDEFDASGGFLDQIVDPEFDDAEPTPIAVDRSGGTNDGTTYVGAGPGPGAKLLAFGPLAAPARAELPERSHVLANARAVATDSRGDVYAAADAFIHVYGPNGTELAAIEDVHSPLEDLAVDSSGHVYVIENEQQVTYYTPSSFPPTGATTYSRHEPPVATTASLGGERPLAIAVNPGPAAGKDRLFLTTIPATYEYESAAGGSTLLNGEFAKGLSCHSVKRSLAIDGATGAVYFGENVGGPVSEVCIVNAGGTEVLARIGGAGAPGGLFGANPKVAVDQANGHVLVMENHGGAAREYDASGGFVAEFGQFTALLTRPQRIAVDNSCALHEPPLTEATTPSCEEFDPASGDVYVAFDDAKAATPDVWAFDRLQYGEPPAVETGAATGIGSGAATLEGTVSPRGFELTSCEFEYLSAVQYEGNGSTFAGAASAPCVPGLAEIGKGEKPVAVHADIGGLDPEERYFFRVVAENTYGPAEGDPAHFGPPVPTTESASSVLYTEATLKASVDPSGLPTKYWFEYGEAGGPLQSTPVDEIAAGDGSTDVEAALIGLAEGTEYDFRVVAENEVSAVQGNELSFTTLTRQALGSCANAEYRFGASAGLPDCRAYELITPAETNGLVPYVPGPTTPGTAFNDWLTPPRGPHAGDAFSYFTEGTLPGFEGSGQLDGYRAQRGPGDHPEAGWGAEFVGMTFSEAGGSQPRGQGISSDQRYAFWLTIPLEGLTGTLPRGTYLRTPDFSAAPACNPALSQSTFELVGCGVEGTDPEAATGYISPGGVHVIFASTKHLAAGAAPEGTRSVYDRPAGSPDAEVVSLQPGGASFGAGEDASYVASTEDGEAVLFRVDGRLYLRHAGQTFQVSSSPSTFAGVSADGTRVYTADGLGDTPTELSVCDVGAGPCAGGASQEIAASGIFLNVAPDGSHALFSSKEALTGAEENDAGERAEAGKHNLYLWSAAGVNFVAVLADGDFTSFGGDTSVSLGAWTRAINPGPQMGFAFAPTRSTPDGRVFLFQSHARLTAYDNEGVGEIYRYDPSAPPGETLTCPSCDPRNAPPGGDAMLERASNETSLAQETIIPDITDDGSRVFFQSPDALLPGDANDVADVYEWREREPASGCNRAGGCLALISSGQGESPSFLYGMSANGHDVFFRTRERLVGADIAGSPSIYDAREGGGIPEPLLAEPCQGDACQGNGTSPPALPAPATTGAGSGNAEAPRPCPKGRRRLHGRCLPKGKKRHHHRHRRHRTSSKKGGRR